MQTHTYPVTLDFVWSAAVRDGGLRALELSRQQLPTHETRHVRSPGRVCASHVRIPVSTHPGKQQGFPRVTQPDQEDGASHGFTGEKVLEEH